MLLLKKFNKIALSSNDHKIIQSIDLIEPHASGMNKDLVCKKKKLNAKI